MADIIADGTIGAKRFLLLDSTGKIPAVDGSQVTALAAGNIATDIIPIARIDVGTTANKLVQLDANAKLPALDASLLTNIPGATKSSSDPAVDTNPSGGVGSEWHNTTSGEAYICTDATTDENVWTNIGAGTGDIEPWRFVGESYGYNMGGTKSPAWTMENMIQKFAFATDGNMVDVANLTVARRFCAGACSDTYGFAMGGLGQNVIDRHHFANATDSTDVGDVSFSSPVAGCSSSTHGYVCANSGGGTPAGVTIEKFSNTSIGNTTNVGDLTHNHNSTGGGTSSADYGYTTGASYPINQGGDKIDKFSFASDGNATLMGLLANSVQLYGNGAFASKTYGYIAGGGNAGPDTYSNVIQKWSFASDGNASDVGDLITGLQDLNNQTSCSTTAGYVQGGYHGGWRNQIQKISTASDGNATDAGDLLAPLVINGAGVQI